MSLWGPVLAFMAATWLGAAPVARVPVAGFWDKPLHAAAYGLFGVLSVRAFHGGLGILRRRPTLAAAALVLLYAAVDELHQRRIPGRESSVADWVADAAGLALGLIVVGALLRRRGEQEDEA